MTSIRHTPDTDPYFTPPHCPNQNCPFHIPGVPDWKWGFHGVYTRRSDQRSFRRFRCLHCFRTFSTRTFCSDYWLRERDLLPKVADIASNGAGLRQIARHYRVAHSTVARLIARGGRHCLLFHKEETKNLEIAEPIAFDGFETFEYSQFFPFHINLAAGRKSWFLYELTDSPLRRKGRMTPGQRRRRAELEAELGRPDPKAVELGTTTLLCSVLERIPTDQPAVLESDEHPAYPRAIRRVVREAEKVKRKVSAIIHRTISSRAARARDNPLFAINLADLLFRHSHANHRRETIAFSKRRMAAISRAQVFRVWRNWVKRRTENGGDTTAAMVAGVAEQRLDWDDVFRRRLFPGHAGLAEFECRYYAGQVFTAALGKRQQVHELRMAF
ncbi:MAG: IS1 family transposase [Candidatus Eisenbacteria bacterium]|nr:IS1 family transposase [Candidatus Eisenbacteria bacterium]